MRSSRSQSYLSCSAAFPSKEFRPNCNAFTSIHPAGINFVRQFTSWSSVLLSLFAARHNRLCPGTTGSLLRRRVFDMWVPVQSRILGPRCAVSEQGPRPSCNFSSLLFWDASHGLNDIGPSLVHDKALNCFLLEHLSTISTPTCVEWRQLNSPGLAFQTNVGCVTVVRLTLVEE